MPRPKALVPALRFHISGQSICEINGTTYYLGPADSPESLARYAVLIREYQTNGLKVPSYITSQTLAGMAGAFLAAPEKVDKSQEPISVRHITAGYREYAKARYAKSKKEIYRMTAVCDALEKHTGSVLASEFGPKLLKAQRQRWIDEGTKCRKYINLLTNSVMRIFRWAVEEELVDEGIWQRLKSIEPLHEGQTTAKDNAPVRPVDLEVVRKTVAELSPIVRDMVRVQVATGMRPSELCSMRPADIDRSGPEWIYRPRTHKNAKRGKSRSIPLVGDARSVVENYLNRGPDAFLFSPIEADQWFRAKQRSERKGYGSYKPVKGTLKIGECYTPNSYRQAIVRAAERAKVKAWFPYQLRHLNLTAVRKALGVEAAQAMAGHSRVDMTETYAQVALEKAIEAAKAAPKL